MPVGLVDYLAQEDPKRPYTDQQLAQLLGLRREQVGQQDFQTPGPAFGRFC